MVIDLNVSNGFDDEEIEDELEVEESSESKEVSVSDLESEPIKSIRNQIEEKLQVGAVNESLEVIYILYCEYARLSGFSVKKGTQGYFQNTMDVRLKVYHCSCEGYPDNKRSVGRIASYKKQVTRTNCKARLRVIREEEGPWTVSVFFRQHNHELVSPEQSYMLRSARHMSHAKKSVLEALRSAGIKVNNAYRFMEKEAGGRSNLGFTKNDAYAHVNLSRMKSKVENGDANALLKYFIGKGNNEPHFYWNVDLDYDGRLKNFFFRDTRCAIDYDCFGDVLSVDTTYRTNKYNLVCAPFVGVNHHRSNVMFGLAFLSDETTKSFEWLFGSFLESMNGKEPGILFSDQCQALMNGVDFTFQTASHRLCQWYINQNSPSHFGALNGNPAFKKTWYHCMNGCENESEFDSTWQTMVNDYELIENRWFRNMYNLRKHWASVFTNDKFTAGLHATSRSEVTNKVLKDLCASTTSLYEFVIQYERLQHEWRLRESEEDTMCRGVPGQFIQNNNLLKHAATVYTRNVFKSFEYETAHSLNVKIIHHPYDFSADELVYGVSSSSAYNGIRTVHFTRHTRHATCSCRMWEAEGILCCHILTIFLLLNVDSVPEHFILKRWRKDAKHRVGRNNASPTKLGGTDSVGNMVFVNHNMRTLYNLMLESKADKMCRDVINKCVQSLVKEIQRLKLERAGANGDDGSEGNKSSHAAIRNPRTPKKQKILGKRLRRHWDCPRPKRAAETSKKRSCLDDDSFSNLDQSQYEPWHSSQISGSRQWGSSLQVHTQSQSQTKNKTVRVV